MVNGSFSRYAYKSVPYGAERKVNGSQFQDKPSGQQNKKENVIEVSDVNKNVNKYAQKRHWILAYVARNE